MVQKAMQWTCNKCSRYSKYVPATANMLHLTCFIWAEHVTAAVSIIYYKRPSWSAHMAKLIVWWEGIARGRRARNAFHRAETTVIPGAMTELHGSYDQANQRSNPWQGRPGQSGDQLSWFIHTTNDYIQTYNSLNPIKALFGFLYKPAAVGAAGYGRPVLLSSLR